MPTVRDVFIDGPQGKIFVRVWASFATTGATPIILLHDSLGSVDLWREFPAKLAVATGRMVLAYDRLGFGRSDPHPDKLANDFVREEARTGLPLVRTRLQIERMILLGHSVGGGMAVAAGAAFPHETEAVITLSAQAFVEDQTLAGIRAAQTAFEAPGQIERLTRYHKEKALWVLDAWTKTWLSPEFATWSLEDDLRALQCSILAIHGDRDEFGTCRQLEQIGRTSPKSEILILQDCGHVPHREQPRQVLEAVSFFLRKLDCQSHHHSE